MSTPSTPPAPPLFDTTVDYVVVIGLENFWDLDCPDEPTDRFNHDTYDRLALRMLDEIPEVFDTMFDMESWVKACFDEPPTPDDVSRVLAALDRIAMEMGFTARKEE